MFTSAAGDAAEEHITLQRKGVQPAVTERLPESRLILGAQKHFCEKERASALQFFSTFDSKPCLP
jgi:hypothetical protein